MNSFFKNNHHIHIYECLGVYAMLKPLVKNRDKFSPRALRCVFLGYPLHYKAYRVYDLEHKFFFISRDVTFEENIFPYHLLTPDPTSSPVLPLPIPEIPSNTVSAQPTISPPLPHVSSVLFFLLAAQTPLKLTSTNYLAWKLQFQTLFIGYDLLRFIDGSLSCPASNLQGTTTHYGWDRMNYFSMSFLVLFHPQ